MTVALIIAAPFVLAAIVEVTVMWWKGRQPVSDMDRYCASVDAELDELAARRATRPHTDGVVVVGPWDRSGAA